MICVRCRQTGHLARACPALVANPLPKEERIKIYKAGKMSTSTKPPEPLAGGERETGPPVSVSTSFAKSAQSTTQEVANVVETDDSVTAGALQGAVVADLRYVDVRLEFPDPRSHSRKGVWERALIDSGADSCFAGEALALEIESLGGSFERLASNSPISVTLANGSVVRPVGYLRGVAIWLNDKIRVDTDRIYLMPIVSGSIRGLIVPYCLLGELTVSWTLTPEGDTTVVFGESARLIYEYSRAARHNDPKCAITLQRKGEDCREPPLHCSYIGTVDEVKSPPKVSIVASKPKIPIRLIPDSDAVDGRPTVGIPWRQFNERPPLNYRTCFDRDKRTFSRLSDKQRDQCLTAFQVFIDKKFVVPTLPCAVPDHLDQCYPKDDEELFDCERHVGCLTKRFIPMFPVYDSVSKTTRCRLVLDARSDNFYLSKTPSGVRGTRASLFHNLFHFRCSKYFVLLDLSTAFLGISLACGDREYAGTIMGGMAFSFRRMPFGCSFSPYGLSCSLDQMVSYWQDHEVCDDDGEPLPLFDANVFSAALSTERGAWIPAGEKPLWNLTTEELEELLAYYVDDLCVGGDIPTEVKAVAIYVIWRLARHGSIINKMKTMSHLHGREEESYRHLGYHIAKGKMFSSYGTGRGSQASDQSRRYALGSKGFCVSLLSREFDPLGLNIEHTAMMRLLSRRVTSSTKSWESVVPDSLYKEVLDWVSLVSDPCNTIPWERFCDPSELYCFVDASDALWAIDVRCEGADSTMPHVRLVGNVGVHPLVSRSIPAKELDSLYRGIKLVKKVMSDCGPENATKIKKVTFFTDSEITIHRLRAWRSGRSHRLDLATFERNRICQIVDFLDTTGFVLKHVAGQYSPADRATRPGSALMETSDIDLGLKKGLLETSLQYNPQPKPEPSSLASRTKMVEVKCNSYDLVISNDVGLCDRIRSSQERDDWTQGMKAKIKDGAVLRSPATRGLCIDEVTGLLCKRTLNWKVVNEVESVDFGGLRYIVPDGDQKLQDEIIEKLHAHGGLPQNIRMLCSHFHFKHMKAKCKKYLNACETCERIRTDQEARKATANLPAWQTNWQPWECVSLDIVGPLCPGCEDDRHQKENPKQLRYYLSFVDVATKFMINVPIANRLVTTLVSAVDEVFVTREQIPKCLITDRESGFLSKTFQSYLLTLPFVIHHVTGAPYQGPHGGHYERLHADITKFLKGALVAAGENAFCWHRHLPEATRLHNVMPFDQDIDLSPMDLFRGYAPRRLLDNLEKDEIVDKLHMVSPDVPSIIQDLASQIKSGQEVKFREYRRLWQLRRSESFEKVLSRIRHHRELHLGDIVYRWRPARAIDTAPSGLLSSPLDHYAKRALKVK